MKTNHSNHSKMFRILAMLVVFAAAAFIASYATSAPPRRSARPRPAHRPARHRHVKHPHKHPTVRKRVAPLRAVPVAYGGAGTTIVVTEGESSESASAAPVQTAAPAEKITASPSDKDESFASSTPYEVAGLRDGGLTVILKVDGRETPVRMIGIASAKFKSPPKGAPDAPGRRGKGPKRPKRTQMFLDNMLRGESVYIVYDSQVEDQDEEGKYIAYLYRVPDGLPINLEAVRQGFAVTDTRYDFDEKNTFEYYQQHARKAEKGIWGKPKGPPRGGALE